MVTNYWYVSHGEEQPLGPFKEKDLIRKLQSGEIKWSQYACNPAMDFPWTRIFELHFLHAHLPPQPSQNLYREIHDNFIKFGGMKKPTRPDWLLQFNGSQFGPMTTPEVELLIKKINIKSTLYAWRPGLKGWTEAEAVPELRKLVEKIQAVSSKMQDAANRRKSSRANLLATVTITTVDGDQLSGVCRDISQGGIYVVASEELPLHTEVTLSVEPISDCGINKFRARGRVVSGQRDNDGIAFEFTDISVTAVEQIGMYTSSQDVA